MRSSKGWVTRWADRTKMETTMSTKCCSLCGETEAHRREGRLGRYAQTCELCEAKRGSHLVPTPDGYANASVLASR